MTDWLKAIYQWVFASYYKLVVIQQDVAAIKQQLTDMAGSHQLLTQATADLKTASDKLKAVVANNTGS